MIMKTLKLGDCLSLVQNGAVIKQSPNAGGIPITRIETLSNDRFNRNRLGYADIDDCKAYASYILEDKDILMSHINSRVYLGRAVIYRKEGDETIIHGMNLLRIKTKEFADMDAETTEMRETFSELNQIMSEGQKKADEIEIDMTDLNLRLKRNMKADTN